MVFTSIHPSLKPSLFSIQGPNLSNPWLNLLHPFQLPVHPLSFNHLSRILVFISTLKCLSIGRVSETCQASYFHIRALRHIRSSLTTDACKTIAAAIVESRLDYCNSLLAGTSVSNLSRLQLVQNTLARVVTGKYRFCRITPVLSDLHWLPVGHRINFKIVTITLKVLQFQQPSYLAALIPRHVPTRSLRSSSSLSICVPTRKTAMVKSKSFSSVASYILNKLPCHLSSISTLPTFRKRLKHHLLSSASSGNPSSSTGITFCDVSPPTNATQIIHIPPPS